MEFHMEKKEECMPSGSNEISIWKIFFLPCPVAFLCDSIWEKSLVQCPLSRA